MRLAILAPNLALRAGLRALLSAASEAEAGERIEVVAEAAAWEDLWAALPGAAPEIDLLLAVAATPPQASLRQAAERQGGQLALLLLADDPQAASGWLRLPWRAWGLLPLDSSAEELQAAARAVHAGLVVAAPAMLSGAAGAQAGLARLLAGAPVDAERQPIEALTEREAQVLGLLGRGLANKQIAVELGISEHTAKFHISSIYARLGVTNRTEAVRVGVQNGLIVL
ncbi:MAG: response regulator transcription factor [Chloroflexota bacterium]